MLKLNLPSKTISYDWYTLFICPCIEPFFPVTAAEGKNAGRPRPGRQSLSEPERFFKQPADRVLRLRSVAVRRPFFCTVILSALIAIFVPLAFCFRAGTVFPDHESLVAPVKHIVILSQPSGGTCPSGSQQAPACRISLITGLSIIKSRVSALLELAAR